LKIQQISPDKITPYPGNPRKNAAAVEVVADLISRFGFRQPIVVDREMVVVVGHTRLEAARKLELETVPVEVAGSLSPDDARAYRIADNKSAEFAAWDEDLLIGEIRALESAGFEIDALHFSDAELSALKRAAAGNTPEDEAPPLDDKVKTKTGDVWRLGRHRLICGNATLADDVTKLLEGAAPRLMVTDPPYGVDYAGGQVNKRKREKLVGDQTADIFAPALKVAASFMPAGAWYVWHAGRVAEPVYSAIRQCGFEVRALIIWNKINAHFGAPSAHYLQSHEPCLYAVKGSAGWTGASTERTVWDIPQPHRNEYHPTQKPVECMRRPVVNNCKPGGDVYDPFVGSGTTIIAAETVDRRCFAVELSPNYCDVAIKRWQNFTGEKAKRADGVLFDRAKLRRMKTPAAK